jgi:hypothetical protein
VGRRYLALLAALFACGAGAQAAIAGTVTIGPRTLSTQSTLIVCDGSSIGMCDTATWAQATLADPGASVAAPYDGSIVSWRMLGAADPSTQLFLRVLRPAGGNAYKAAGTSAPTTNASGTPNQTNLPVAKGDHIGLQVKANGGEGEIYTAPSSDTYLGWGSFPDGTTATGDAASDTLMLNAELRPAAPILSGLNPASGPATGGQTVVISGSHLAGASAVTFGATPAAGFSVVSNTQIDAFTPAGSPGTVDVTVTGPGGDRTAPSNASKYTYLGDGVAAPPPDVVPPAISRLKLSPTRFVAANSGPATTAASVGTRVSYMQTENGTTNVTFQRPRPGRKRKGRCVKPSKARHGKRCTRWVAVAGHITIAGHAGKNSFRFMGRVNGKALKRGRYRLLARATDGAGNKSERRHTPFRIVR